MGGGFDNAGGFNLAGTQIGGAPTAERNTKPITSARRSSSKQIRTQGEKFILQEIEQLTREMENRPPGPNGAIFKGSTSKFKSESHSVHEETKDTSYSLGSHF